MPQFYENDNLTCWVSTLIEEHYEMFCADKEMDNANEFKDQVMSCIASMKDWVEDYLIDADMLKKNASLTQAVMNSVDWKAVFQSCYDYFEMDEPNPYDDCGDCGKYHHHEDKCVKD